MKAIKNAPYLALAWMIACNGGGSGDDAAVDGIDMDWTTDDALPDPPPMDTGDADPEAAADASDPMEEEAIDPCSGHCSNGSRDCGETGIDCGGGGCPTCAEGTHFFCSFCGSPNVAVASPDRVMVVWKDVAESPFDIYYSCFDGSDWTEPAAVHVTGRTSAYPRLAVDAAGRFHLAHSEDLGTNRKVMYSNYSNEGGCDGTWSDLERLDREDYTPVANYNSCWPNIDVDENGDPWVAWTEDDYYKVHVTHRSGGEWTTPEDAAPPDGEPPCNSAHPDIAAAGTTGYVGWQEGHFGTDYDRTILFTEWTGDGWTEPLVIADRDYYVWTQIQADASGNVYVMATGKNAPNQPVRCKARIGGEWTGWVNVSSAPTDYTWSSIRLHPATGLHAVWAQEDVDVDQIYYATGNASANEWNTPVKISDVSRDAVMPVVDVDDEGYAHIVYTEFDEAAGEDDGGRIYYWKVRYEDL